MMVAAHMPVETRFMLGLFYVLEMFLINAQ